MTNAAEKTLPRIDIPVPANEEERIDTLHASQLLDSTEEEVFNSMTRIAQAHFNVPIALFSLVDRNRQWFKAKCGLDAEQTSRDISFCTHTIMEPSVMVILDALKDERFADNPLVTGDPKIRFYAGAPVVIPDGIILGTLCLIDSKPRKEFTAEQKKTLADMAFVVAHLVELRLLKD